MNKLLISLCLAVALTLALADEECSNVSGRQACQDCCADNDSYFRYHFWTPTIVYTSEGEFEQEAYSGESEQCSCYALEEDQLERVRQNHLAD